MELETRVERLGEGPVPVLAGRPADARPGLHHDRPVPGPQGAS